MTTNRADSSALIIIAITEAIQKGSSRWGRINIPENWAETTFDLLDETTQKRLKKLLDDGGLGRFLISELERMIILSDQKVENEERQLIEYDCLKDPLAVARTISSSLDGLPRQYRLIARGPAELAHRLKREDVSIRISDQMSLISGKLIPKSFQLANPHDALDQHIRRDGFDASKPFVVDSSALYFEYRCSGYIGNRSDTRIGRDFFDHIRAFYGACLAFNILMNMDFRLEDIQPIVAANQIDEGSEELCYLARAEDDIIRSANLATSGSYDKVIEKGETPLEKSLSPIIGMFGSKESARLTTAAIWILRANLSPRQMDKVLEATIALEVLLGDKETSDRIGLSKLMANRCAYALGKSVVERRGIVDFFVEFYRIRSDIVHSGRFKIEEDDKEAVSKGIDLAVKMLRHEVGISK